MAKKNELVEVLEGEVIGPDEASPSAAEAEEDYTIDAKNIADTDAKFDKQETVVLAHTKEGRRLLFTFAASAAVMAASKNDVSYVNRFIKALGSDRRNPYRSDIFKSYFEKIGPVDWDVNRMVDDGKGGQKREAGFVMNKDKRNKFQRARTSNKAKFDTGLMKTAPWQMSRAETEYKGFSLPQAIAAAVQHARRQTDPKYLEKLGVKLDDVKQQNDLRGLKDLEEWVDKYPMKKKAATHGGNEARH